MTFSVKGQIITILDFAYSIPSLCKHPTLHYPTLSQWYDSSLGSLKEMGETVLIKFYLQTQGSRIQPKGRSLPTLELKILDSIK